MPRPDGTANTRAVRGAGAAAVRTTPLCSHCLPCGCPYMQPPASRNRRRAGSRSSPDRGRSHLASGGSRSQRG